MGLETNFPFAAEDQGNYITSDDAKFNWNTGGLDLTLENNPNQDFTETFDSDTGFIYDSDLTEFTGGQVQQKDQVPANAICGATYDEDVNLEAWSGGVVTGDAQGGAGITDQKLDLTGGVNKYVDYDATGNADSQQTGCIRFEWIPDFSGGGTQYIIELTQAAGNANNRIRMYLSGALLFWAISDSAGGSIVSQSESFTPVADTIYEIELNWDITSGATRMFIDGTQLGSTHTGTGTRSSSIGLLRLGKDLDGNGNPQFSINNLIIFDTVQHTSNYTPGYTVPNHTYAASNVTLPEMEYTGAGTLVSLDSFTTSESGSPRYTIQIGRSGNYLYWDGAAWSTSDGTYSQANDVTTFNANRATLPINGEIYRQFKINFTDSNTQSAVATLTASLTAQIYPTSNPYVDTISYIKHEDLINLIITAIITGNDQIKIILSKNGQWYYHDTTQWTASDGTYSQANTVAEIFPYLGDFTDVGIETKARLFLHSDDGSTTPTLENLYFEYNFYGEEDTIQKCIIWDKQVDEEGVGVTDSITVKLSNDMERYGSYTTLRRKGITVSPMASGYWEQKLIVGETYKFDFGNDEIFERVIPDASSVNFDQLEAPS